MAVPEIKTYNLLPTALIPNSPRPLLYYPGYLLSQLPTESQTKLPSPNDIAVAAYKLFTANSWRTEWIYRYGPTQASHYHSRAHECMVVLSGTAQIRFGIEDGLGIVDGVGNESASGIESATDEKGIVISASVGDVFILPAGVAHKTHNVSEGSTFALLTPGNGHGIDSSDATDDLIESRAKNQCDMLSRITIDGFAMMASYPAHGPDWNFATGGEDTGPGGFERVWAVPKPVRDPVLGDDERGLAGLW